MDVLKYEYILENLMKLVRNDSCCVFFLGPFYNLNDQVYTYISNLNLKIQNQIINGHAVKRIYNVSCCHCMDLQRPFHLGVRSKQEALYQLKFGINSGIYQELLPTSLYKVSRLYPVLPANRFSIASLRPNTFYFSTTYREMIPKTWPLYPFKKELVKRIKGNRLLIVNGDASLQKSTAIPLLIAEDCIANKLYCKILCLESDNLLAITNSTFVADHLNERIGDRVGFQVFLQSRVCDNTNIIYTTAIFFLRVLMGQNSKESFRFITHVIISDVHLHKAYKDIFIKELKKILPHYPHIKVILLSDSSNNELFLSYFGEGTEFCIKKSLFKLSLYHLEDIYELVQEDQFETKFLTENVILNNGNNVHNIADKILENYSTLGCETAWNNFIYLIKNQQIHVNYTHSKLGYTALIAAAKRNNPMHVRCLMAYEDANPFLQDKCKLNALEYAISIKSIKCIEALTEKLNITKHEPQLPSIDFEIIMKLIYFITTRLKFGNILIFLPSYDNLLKLYYNIMKSQFFGKIQQEICIHLLHENMQPEQLEQMIFDKIKIILATELAENLSYLNDITYVIDAGQISIEKYSSKFKCNEFKTEWASQESLQRRSSIASRFEDGYCFRLFSRKIFDKLKPKCSPELHYIPINRISLTVKLLCPNSMVTKYFEDTLTKPPPEHIEDSIKFLKDIESLDSALEVTWLGCRLIDVPVNLELGKCLVMSILFKCLDPVLTIVSFLTYNNSFNLLKQSDSNTKFIFIDGVNESFSDHLRLLRLYQSWQNEKRTKLFNDAIGNEENFILNRVLENVCEIRTNLVGALRSSQLIHNQGLLSMHSINLKANNWAMIKAAIACGLYPKLCMINSFDDSIKSKSSKLCIDETSTLHPAKFQRLKTSPSSDWIVYYNEWNYNKLNKISNCTLVSSVIVALFAGKMEMNSKNLCFTKDRVGYFIDENISLITDKKSALLVFKLRQKIFSAYMEYLQTCTDTEKWKRQCEFLHVFDVLSNIILEEDENAGFLQPVRVGNRPKAISSKSVFEFQFSNNNQNLNIIKKTIEAKISYVSHKKEFFLINMFASQQTFQSFSKLFNRCKLTDSYIKPVFANASKESFIYTYIILCNATQKRITYISLIKYENEEFVLKYCFEVNIPVRDIIISCTTLNINLPPLRPNGVPYKIDRIVGELILHLW